MRFNSLVFLLFLSGTVLAYWLLPHRFRRWLLLASSWIFYGSWHLPFLGLLIGAGALNHLGARWIVAAESRARRGWMLVGANLALLGLFKYLDWGVGTANELGELLGLQLALPLPGWLLPLGISFYLFECISYVVDLVRKRECLHGFWDFQLYLAFFPHLVAGPILRAKELLPQLERPAKLDLSSSFEAFWKISTGLALKVVLADNLATEVDYAFSREPSSLGTTDVVVMASAFGLQIYLDFASYSRIALGAAALFGLQLVENFQHPYSSSSPVTFWNRWHMSLSRWIRDYIFYPLVGGKAELWPMCRAALLTMTLCGVWHGAGWTFLLWGLWHGLLIAANHVVNFALRGRIPASGTGLGGRARTAFGVILTFGLVSTGWLFFRSTSVAQAFELLSVLLRPWSHLHRTLSGTFYLQTTVFLALVWLAPTLERWLEPSARVPARPAALAARGVIAAVSLATFLVYLHGRSAFIYFQF